MSEFIVEVYVPRTSAPCTTGVREACAEHTRSGSPVTYLRAILVPEDETCFLLFDADSPETVRAVVTQAAVPVERIAAAIESL